VFIFSTSVGIELILLSELDECRSPKLVATFSRHPRGEKGPVSGAKPLDWRRNAGLFGTGQEPPILGGRLNRDHPVAYLNSGSILSPSLMPPGSITFLSANFSAP
jgi:hypothetical protein